jgi:hypothetical protein
MITLDGTSGITTPDVDTDGLTVDTNTLFVDAANNRVGVGTSSPAVPLHVFTTSSEPARFVRDLATDAGLSVQSDNSGPILDTIGVHNLRFFTNAAERARIDASGNLLVGATSMVASGKALIQWNSSTGVEGLILDDTDSTAVGRFAQKFRRNGSVVGSVQTTLTATVYATSSDYRLKEDVQPMVGSVDRLMALKPVNFAWKVDGSRVDGFLAHEAQEVVPECVTGEKDAVDDEGKPVYQGIDQSKLAPLLVAALQEALTKIEALEARVAALETNA